MKKSVIIINGVGGSGKDTICNIVSKYYKTEIISQIDPIKEIAKYGGWNGEKDDKSRKMLSDLKMLFVAYNNLPFNYSIEKINEFEKTDKNILFIHIREKEEISKIVTSSPLKVYTLLIKRSDKDFIKRTYGNFSDDSVDDYDYDFIYDGNNETEVKLENDFMEFFNTKILPNLL